MPRYHFHSADGVRQPDEHGVELSSEREARQQAVAFAGEVLRDAPDTLWQKGQWRVEVTDHDGRLLFTVITLALDAPPPDSARGGGAGSPDHG